MAGGLMKIVDGEAVPGSDRTAPAIPFFGAAGSTPERDLSLGTVVSELAAIQGDGWLMKSTLDRFIR